MTAPPSTDHQAPQRRAIFRPRHRLTHKTQFSAVYDAKLKKPVGPIVVFALPNTLGHPRLGLSVGRRVGNAVARGAIKRRLREAFRHLAADWPGDRVGLDLVVVVRPHEKRRAQNYLDMLESASTKLVRLIEKKNKAEP